MLSFKNLVRPNAAATLVKAVVSFIAMSDTFAVAAGKLDVTLSMASRLDQISNLHAGAEIIHTTDLEILKGQITATSVVGMTAIICPLTRFYQPCSGSIEIFDVVAITRRLAWTDVADRLYVVELGHVRMADVEL